MSTATTKSSRPAFRLWLLVVGTLCLLFILFAFYSDSVKSPLEYAHSKAQEFCDSSLEPPASETETEKATRTASETSTETKTARNCEDPYRRPGFLVIPSDEEAYRETTWMPYTDKFLNAEPPESAAYPPQQAELIFNDTNVPQEFLTGPGMPQQWMHIVTREYRRRRKAINHIENATASDYASMKDDGGLGWLWGRRILEFGDSIDRYEAWYVCQELGSEMNFPAVDPMGKERHAKGICDIPAFNVTFFVFHSAGSFTYTPRWFWYPSISIVAFEERWNKIWKPHEEPINGPNGRPDLVLWQNGLWDQRAFTRGGHKMHQGNTTMNARYRKLVWEELRFYSSRLRKFADRMVDEFPDTPKMFRSLTVHKKTGMEDVMVVEMDRLGRALAEQYGHEIFEWSRIISLLGDLYRDRTHPAKGALSWLWGNMVLEYLARSAGAQVGGTERWPYFEGWDACHEELAGWGGR
ncbi:hypothetical protein FSARC_7394 [Fusarium sarcochroum]|uniref:Uncharacterized protein n=1 Tax=Fusarium sarcochroum TaxID=1208366 RepID=A0A8H4TVC4_9HYPO|nr:hypothetical protein FSARC_7394 [Fusarium sarcochroum]